MHPRLVMQPGDIRWEDDEGAVPDVTKVGPKGYVHGWVYVGPEPGSDYWHLNPDVVRHPVYGEGVAKKGPGPGQVSVLFTKGHPDLAAAPPGEEGGVAVFGHVPSDVARPGGDSTGLRPREHPPHLSPEPFTIEHEAQAKDLPEDVDWKRVGALEAYTAPETNARINAALRRGVMPGRFEGEDLGKHVRTLDRMIAGETLEEPAVLYRGVAMTDALRGKMKKGATFTDPAFVSSTSARDWAESFAERRAGEHPGAVPAVMEVSVPAGAHMTRGETDIGEYILPRGSSFRVDDVSGDGKTMRVSVVPS